MAERRGVISRREILKGGASLVVGGYVHGTVRALMAEPGPEKAHELNAWLRITKDNLVTIVVSQAEMGQGIMTTLPAVLAEELGADWSKVHLEMSPTVVAYRNPRLQWQFTGNSESTMSFFELMREMGASAREMLLQAAAQRWKIASDTCQAEQGFVHHLPSGRMASFGSLVEAASTVVLKGKPKLKPEAQWKLLGTPMPRVDNPSKIDGSAIFGMDVKVPGMLHAAIRNCPVHGGKPKSFDAGAIQHMSGVVGTYALDSAVAVVAESYWQAKCALDKLSVVWDEGPNAEVSTDSLMMQYREAMNGDQWVLVKAAGDFDAIGQPYPNVPLKGVPLPSKGEDLPRETFDRFHTAEYESQFLAHATMEPMNATAQVTAGGCIVWAPTQGQELAQMLVGLMLGIDKAKVDVRRTYLGGGFGRRLAADFVLQAVALSKQTGRPVKAIWSREEDMTHDLYRPAVLHHITAGLDKEGFPLAAAHRVVSPSILQYVFPVAVTDTFDPSCVEGLVETNYHIPNARVDFHLLKVGVPTSVMRTTGYGPNLFATESFLDEEAHLAGKDPYLFRRHLLEKSPRAVAILDLAAAKAGWTTPLPQGVFRGIAFAFAFETMIAQVVELSVEGKQVTVHRVVSAVDCGTVLNPEISTNNIEGGIAWGLSAAFRSKITFAAGRTVESNFHDFEVLRLPEMPACETHFIDSGARPMGGTGEVGPVTVIPALTNALFAATGVRVRSLPLSRHGYRTGWSS